MEPVQQIIFLTTHDRIATVLTAKILNGFPRERILVAVDKSVTFKKVLRLIIKGRISLPWAIRQFIASRKQLQTLPPGRQAVHPDVEVNSNNDLLRILAEKNGDVSLLLAFKAGLIINKKVLEKINCVNIHYARLPDYGGLQAVARALDNHDYNQEATVHRMKPEVDTGETILTVPYRLEPSLPYHLNEMRAMEAGVEAARKFLATVLK